MSDQAQKDSSASALSPELLAALCALLETGEEALKAQASFELLVPAEKHLALAELVKQHGFTLYVTVVASHWPKEAPSKANPAGREEGFEVATVLRKPQPGAPLFSWRVQLKPDQPIDSLYPLFAGADWQEREQYDLVGVKFAGHPDLRRIMMPEDWPGHPLRKDYAIDTAHFPWR